MGSGNGGDDDEYATELARQRERDRQSRFSQGESLSDERLKEIVYDKEVSGRIWKKRLPDRDLR